MAVDRGVLVRRGERNGLERVFAAASRRRRLADRELGMGVDVGSLALDEIFGGGPLEGDSGIWREGGCCGRLWVWWWWLSRLER